MPSPAVTGPPIHLPAKTKKDFNNLLEVYLDAVFFARLDALDFAQEGHRVELVDEDGTPSLVYKGVGV